MAMMAMTTSNSIKVNARQPAPAAVRSAECVEVGFKFTLVGGYGVKVAHGRRRCQPVFTWGGCDGQWDGCDGWDLWEYMGVNQSSPGVVAMVL